VATRCRENVEGEKTAREAVAEKDTNKCPPGNGDGAVKLWRGVKGQERIVRESQISWTVARTKTSEIGFKS
jgi:hypothetical protein